MLLPVSHALMRHAGGAVEQTCQMCRTANLLPCAAAAAAAARDRHEPPHASVEEAQTSLAGSICLQAQRERERERESIDAPLRVGPQYADRDDNGGSLAMGFQAELGNARAHTEGSENEFPWER